MPKRKYSKNGGHRSQLKGGLTDQIWGNLSMKINNKSKILLPIKNP